MDTANGYSARAPLHLIVLNVYYCHVAEGGLLNLLLKAYCCHDAVVRFLFGQVKP